MSTDGTLWLNQRNAWEYERERGSQENIKKMKQAEDHIPSNSDSLKKKKKKVVQRCEVLQTPPSAKPVPACCSPILPSPCRVLQQWAQRPAVQGGDFALNLIPAGGRKRGKGP